jgi:hypothetical protein
MEPHGIIIQLGEARYSLPAYMYSLRCDTRLALRAMEHLS